MAKIFNTVFENSLHTLILLDVYEGEISADLIAYLDFIIIYSKSLGVGDKNINGENECKHGELPSRRRTIKNALKRLVIDGMVNAKYTDDGMKYKITEHGIEYVVTLESEYANEYRQQAEFVISEFVGMNEQEVNSFILNNLKNEKVK